MSDFQFGLDQRVAITVSGERGHVVGRAQYCHGENQYLVRYKSAEGCAKQVWWEESSLEIA
jgi:hypothetical protein